VKTAPTFTYEMTIGCWGRIAHPVDVKVNENTGSMYVLNRSTAWQAPHGRAVGVVIVDRDEKVVHEFGRLGTEPGQLFMPSALALGPDHRVYVADEHLHAISVFDEDGTFVERWGSKGADLGELNRPSGLAFDGRGRLFIVDHANARVQCFTPSGDFIDAFGSPGRGPGELHLPWGIAIDGQDRIWIADWGNDRIQSFRPDGVCERVVGGAAGEGVTLCRPAALAIDHAGIMYVTDWGNNRVLVFDSESNHIATWHGDSTLSKWAVERIKEFPIFEEQRQASGLYDQERRFWRPAGITALSTGRVLVVDSCRHRVQVYRRQPMSVAA
jgi:DNA-binding beta-propeller fold protein YncE